MNCGNWRDTVKYFAIVEEVNKLAGDFSYDCMSATGRITEGQNRYPTFVDGIVSFLQQQPDAHMIFSSEV